mgnify:CR=1 FL=1
MITKIENGIVTVEDYGLAKGKYCVDSLTLLELVREQKILLAKMLEWDDKTSAEVKAELWAVADQLADIIDSKCKENKPCLNL